MRPIISPGNQVTYGAENVDHLLRVEIPHPGVAVHNDARDGEAPGDQEQDQGDQLQEQPLAGVYLC